ncbi:MAG: WYL domain-containing protein [Flavobacteriales bacterium]|nr:WYL domain-containing protein [Flavobacteriales bacterium]
MSKRGYITRYQLILKKLKTKPYSTLAELQGYVERQYEYLKEQDDTLKIGFSKRTFQRDIREIRTDFGIDIEYSRKEKGFFISSSEMDSTNFERRMEAFDTFNALNLTKDLSSFILLEKRRPKGTDNLYGILHAIKNRYQIKFSYQKFWEEVESQRKVEPYAIKEFKNRWYIMAKDTKDNKVKSFAIDRLANFEITNTLFEYPENHQIEETYKYCFGIISPESNTPEKIILSFNPFQGKYIKSLPLHETQEVILDNKQELRISLKLYITYDLVMELMSYGNNVKVLEPKTLAKEIKLLHEKAFNQYEKL